MLHPLASSTGHRHRHKKKHHRSKHHHHSSRSLTGSHDERSSRSSRKHHHSSRHLNSSPSDGGSRSPRRSIQEESFSSSSTTVTDDETQDEIPRNRSFDDVTAYARMIRTETSGVLQADHSSLSQPNLALSSDAVHFLAAEAEKLEEFKQTEGKAVVDDAADLLQQFVRQFKSVSGNLRKPNVLLTGITGAGKSSLINSLFGKDVAATGTGVPITQHFTKYEDDDLRVVIYDSKGLEHGQFENFIDTTNDFFDEHKIGTHGESRDAIHVVWYIVNSAHSRFEPFEEHLCRELFNRAPLMFLLNKADISTKDDRERFRAMINDLKLPNCVGVYDTVARKHSPQLLAIDRCPNCGNDDVLIRKKKMQMICPECDYSESLKQSNGLDDMISATVNVLPEVVRDAFVSAQNVSFMLKETTSRVIIEEFYNEFNHVRTPAKLMKIVAKMMARLSVVWEFKKHGHIYGATIAKDLVSSFSLKDRMNLLFHKKTKEQKLHVASLGVLWNRCLRNLAMSLFRAWDANTFETEGSLETCRSLFDEIFAAMNKDMLEEIESNITMFNIKMVLDQVPPSSFLSLSPLLSHQEMTLSEQFRERYSDIPINGTPDKHEKKERQDKHHHHHHHSHHGSHR
eukprot:TRINITY_DN1074_c0_g1_i2.p1 TRINITY_DN1074_c0_g1~~TRINITY_DN1074_c0_g1_i2.p1  ORF type:complete len:648 (+),score=116.23 TRINITY_DN1074_c0_g1_i2:68-1945(+)